jgi:hypothetical protein
LDILLTLVGLVAFGYSLTTIVIPWGWVKKRSHGGLLAISSVVVMVVGTSFGAHVTANAPAPFAADHPQTATKPAADPSKPSEEDKRSFIAAREMMQSNQKDCMAALRKAASTHGRYSSYVVAKNAEGTCRTSANAILGLAQGTGPVKLPETLKSAFQCFGFAEGQKASAMELAAKINDGPDARPSDVAEFRSGLRDALQRDQECGSVLASAEISFGYSDTVIDEIVGTKHGKRSR